MNTNRNRTVTATFTDGTERTFTHRDSLNGWVNALRRMGLDPRNVVSQVDGLPESARV